MLNAILFNAFYTDGNTIEIRVNPEFNATEAADKARFYGHAIGQLPSLLRIDVKTVWRHKGDQAFGGGNNNLLIHTDAAGCHGIWLEETLFHEAGVQTISQTCSRIILTNPACEWSQSRRTPCTVIGILDDDT